ncbi:MAG: hypothetical protein ABSE76_03330 [Minisyncoccia bacterium]|jgi:hypothetical protein
MNKKALILIALIVIGGAVYAYTSEPTVTNAPMVATTTPQTVTQTSSAPQKPAPDQGAGGVYDTSAPPGTPAECAACGQYEGVQKAQCLAALNC